MRRSLAAAALSRGDLLLPSDKLATSNTVDVYNYLLNLKNKTQAKVVSGQRHLSFCRDVHNQTGHWPGMIGKTLDAAHGTWEDYGSDAPGAISECVAYWKGGGLVTFDIHLRDPVSKGPLKPGGPVLTQAQMVQCRTEDGNQANVNLRWMLDIWCDAVSVMRDEGVVLLVRPLHEHNGTSFWYWDNPDLPNLYRYIRGYVLRRGLHNCLWMHHVSTWGNNDGPPSDPHQYLTFYPGDDVVDVLSASVYRDTLNDDYNGSYSDFRFYQYFAPKLATKIIGMAEVGPVKAVVAPENPNTYQPHADLRKLIQGIKDFAPGASFWVNWSYCWSMSSQFNDHNAELLGDPWVVNDEIRY